jgi:hypothetical protein
MAQTEHEVDIRTGRRDGDGHIRVSLFMDEMVALALEGHGERAPTLLLTLDQARRLQDSIARLIALAHEEAARKEQDAGAAWDGEERRRLAS